MHVWRSAQEPIEPLHQGILFAPNRGAVRKTLGEQSRLRDQRVNNEESATRIPGEHPESGGAVIMLDMRDQFASEKGQKTSARPSGLSACSCCWRMPGGV